MTDNEDRTIKMLRKTVEDAQGQIRKGIEALKHASKTTLEMTTEGARPLGRDLMKLADSIADEFEKAVPAMARDLKNIEQAAVEKAKAILKRK